MKTDLSENGVNILKFCSFGVKSGKQSWCPVMSDYASLFSSSNPANRTLLLIYDQLLFYYMKEQSHSFYEVIKY